MPKCFFSGSFFSVLFAACHSRTTRDLFRVVIVYFEFLLLSCFCCIFFFHTWHLQRGVKSQPTRWHYRAGFTYKIKYWIGFFGLWLPDFRFVSSATSAWWNLRQLKNQFRFSFKCDKLFQQILAKSPTSIPAKDRRKYNRQIATVSTNLQLPFARRRLLSVDLLSSINLFFGQFESLIVVFYGSSRVGLEMENAPSNLMRHPHTEQWICSQSTKYLSYSWTQRNKFWYGEALA